jgi:hypothetical protein
MQKKGDNMLRNEDDEKVTAELRDKIKSKMDVAKFFSGFIPVFLGLSFKEIIGATNSTVKVVYVAGWIGIFLILSSLAFSVATMFSLDRLLMPPEFWRIRPSKPANMDLKNEMIKAWLRLFYPSVLCFLGGVIAFLIALTQQIYIPTAIFAVVVLTSYMMFKSLRSGGGKRKE